MAMDDRRRRALIRTWLPTAIIVAIIVGVVVTTAVLLGNGLGAPAPAPTVGQVTEERRSAFTDAGLDYIARTRVVRIDLSEPPVAAAPLGLPDDGEVVLPVIATGDTELDYVLKVYGGGGDPGGMTIPATTVTIRSADGTVAAVEASTRGVRPFRDVLASLVRRADVLGWPAGEQERVLAEVASDTEAGRPFSFVVGPGDRLGFQVSARLDCGVDGYCGTTWLIAPTG